MEVALTAGTNAASQMRRAAQDGYGSCASFWRSLGHFRFIPMNGHHRTASTSPFRADIVAKVENRKTPKISPKLIFGLLCRCVAFQRD
jgi:hypothetical protein